uniref:Sulfotransferase domain-containing protein n=1 Tax=viral metagenome TaxID=1070528 RepID=A0A6C0HQN1_9ZZZZ
MYKKIIIFGFPHCGTSILKSIICHIDNVYEIVDEISKIDDNNIDYINYNFVLCKFPYLINENELITEYSDYIKIFIIRNPLFVFSSLNKRFEYDTLDARHSIDKYIDTIKQFNNFKNTKNSNNLFLIKYEDIFEYNYKNLKYIFDEIGFNYNDNIFDNSKYINKVQFQKNLTIPKTLPQTYNHTAYRLFQINQKFENNNDNNKIDLTKEQYHILTTDINILQEYPENKLFII